MPVEASGRRQRKDQEDAGGEDPLRGQAAAGSIERTSLGAKRRRRREYKEDAGENISKTPAARTPPGA
jgi:hypothetical protein